MAIKTAVAIRNAMLDGSDGVGAAANNGYLRIYTGSMPANPEDAATGTLLAELRFAADAFSAASGGVLTANAITSDASANATGTAGWFRVLKSDGSTALFDGTVTAVGGGGDLELDNVAIQSGADVAVDSCTYTLPQ